MNTVNFNPAKISYTGDVKTSRKLFKENQKSEKADFSIKNRLNKENLKKSLKYTLIAQGVMLTGIFLMSVGRNPGKMAKVLNGTSEIVNPAYSKMQGTVDSLIQKAGGGYKTNYADLLESLKTPKNMMMLQDKLEEVQSLIEKQETPPSKEVLGAIESLKKKSADFVETIKMKRTKGEDWQVIQDAQEAFRLENQTDACIIGEYVETLKQKAGYGTPERGALSKLMNSFEWKYSNGDMTSVKRNLIDCPKDVIATGQTLFHGTQNARAVYKKGFTPYVSNQLSRSPRELGAGIYVTPDIKVATSFSSINGTVIPVKLSEDIRIALVDEQTYRATTSKINDFLFERIPREALDKMPKEEKNAIIELLYQRVMKDSGYDAAYIPKGVKQGFNLFGGDINEMCGRPQSQVVIFSPEKLQITDRGLKDRICDFKDKMEGVVHAFKYMHDHPFAGLL